MDWFKSARITGANLQCLYSRARVHWPANGSHVRNPRSRRPRGGRQSASRCHARQRTGSPRRSQGSRGSSKRHSQVGNSASQANPPRPTPSSSRCRRPPVTQPPAIGPGPRTAARLTNRPSWRRLSAGKVADLRFVRAAVRSIFRMCGQEPGGAGVDRAAAYHRGRPGAADRAGGDSRSAVAHPPTPVRSSRSRKTAGTGLPGRIIQELVSNARTIGGIGPRAGQLAGALYASFVQGARSRSRTPPPPKSSS